LTLFLLAILSTQTLDADRGSAWWVFFADRGPDVRERAAAMEAELTPACLERRAAAGMDPLTDETDLPPWAGYVDEVGLIAGREDIRTASRWLNAVSVTATPMEIEAIRSLPFVASVRPVAASAWTPPRFTGTNDLAYGQLAQIGVNTLLARGYDGGGLQIGILDTGFNLDHVCFATVDVTAEHDFLNDDDETGWEAGDPESQAAHGTAVLSLIGGLEPGIFTGAAHGASFALAKTEDTSDEYPQEEDFWVEGLEWLEGLGCVLVSSSLGYVEWYGWEDLDGGTAVTTIAADLAASRGMPVFNAIGNYGPAPGTLIAPADGDSVLAVGAVEASGALAEFSSRGPTWDGRHKPDVCAGGVFVIVASDAQTGYHGGSGTSFATPLVSGAAALLLEAHPEWTALDALDALRATASQAGTPDDGLGWGIVDAHAALMYRSVTGSVRRSDTGGFLENYPFALVIGGETHVVTTNDQGWFAFCPGTTGPFTIEDSGPWDLLPASGMLDSSGVELELFVDVPSSGYPPTAFPVPSTGGVWFGFDLDAASEVSLDILDLSGCPVRSMGTVLLEAGAYRAPVLGEALYWDGLGGDGEPAASGVYFALLRLGDETLILKTALVR